MVAMLPSLLVVVDEPAEIEIGQNVGIHHQEGLRQVGNLGERPRGPQRLLLTGIADVHPPPGAVLKVGGNEVREITHRQGDAAESLGRQLPDDHLHHRHAPQRDQRLGDYLGQGGQPHPLAPC